MRKRIKRIIAISLIFSIFLYFLGILTGYIFSNEISKIIERKNNLTDLLNEIKVLNEEFEKLKIVSISQERCKIIEKLLEETHKTLIKYFSLLPYRLEELELKETPKFYLEMKNEYTKLEINAWLYSRILEECDKKYISILYFYKPKCSECVKQGIEMDKIRDFLINSSYKVFVFTVDVNFNSKTLEIIKSIYNISDAPSFIFKNISFIGFTSFDEFLSFFQSLQTK